MVHLSFGGHRCAGKSSIPRLLSKRHVTIWIKRDTCRPRRWGEPFDEYNFWEREEFALLKRNGGLLLPPRPVFVEGAIYHTGIPAIRRWPDPSENTELIISVFGRSAPLVKEIYEFDRRRLSKPTPKMITIFLASTQKDLQNRLLARAKKMELDPSEHLETNKWYLKSYDVSDYDHIVWNFEDKALECVKQIEKIAGLSPATDQRP